MTEAFQYGLEVFWKALSGREITSLLRIRRGFVVLHGSNDLTDFAAHDFFKFLGEFTRYYDFPVACDILNI